MEIYIRMKNYVMGRKGRRRVEGGEFENLKKKIYYGLL